MPLTLPILPEADRGETGPYCVIAQHRAKPGLADALEQRMLADIPLTRAEPGCLQFHLHRDRADRNLFVVYEIWRDLAALKFSARSSWIESTMWKRCCDEKSGSIGAGRGGVRYLGGR